MKTAVGRVRRLFAGSALAIAGAALTACGGGSEDTVPQTSKAAAESSVALQAHARRAMAYKRAGITAIVASTDGKSVAVAHSDGRVSLLDASSRNEVRQLTAAGSSVAAGLVFSADGRSLVSVDRDSRARVWNVETGVLRLTLSGHEHPLRSVGANADSSIIATAGEETRVMVWDGGTGHLKRILSGATDFVNTVSVSPDGRQVASGDASSHILVWSVATGKLLNNLSGHTNEVDAVAFSPDGRLLASAGEDGKVMVWDAAGGQVSSVLQGGGAPMRSLAFSSDGLLLAAGDSDGHVKVWDMNARKPLPETSNTGAAVNALTFGFGDKSELLFGDAHSSVLSMSVSRQSAR
jgi:WD40 repeat protein